MPLHRRSVHAVRRAVAMPSLIAPYSPLFDQPTPPVTPSEVDDLLHCEDEHPAQDD